MRAEVRGGGRDGGGHEEGGCKEGKERGMRIEGEGERSRRREREAGGGWLLGGWARGEGEERV